MRAVLVPTVRVRFTNANGEQDTMIVREEDYTPEMGEIVLDKDEAPAKVEDNADEGVAKRKVAKRKVGKPEEETE